MLDHVTIGVANLDRSRAFYDAALAPLEIPLSRGSAFDEWGDFSISVTRGRAVTRRAEVAFAARTRANVEAFERASEGGVDPDGNVVRAVFTSPDVVPGAIDHIVLAVRDVERSARFFDLVAPGERDRSVRLRAGEPTANIHFAFAAPDNAAVDDFWRRGTEGGYIDNGAPGERSQYHRGYYAAFLLDPDGNNVEAVCHNR